MKKSLYLFLSSLLGVMLFLTIHRIIIFLLLIFSGASGNLYYGLSSLGFSAIDYLTLIITLMLGAWYGIWVGSYWYGKVYEEKIHGGVVSFFANRYWSGKVGHLRRQMAVTASHLENDIWDLEDLVKELPAAASAKPGKVMKRRIARKRTPKKVLS